MKLLLVTCANSDSVDFPNTHSPTQGLMIYSGSYIYRFISFRFQKQCSEVMKTTKVFRCFFFLGKKKKDQRVECSITECLVLMNRSDVFTVNLKHISHLIPVFLLLTFSRPMPTGYSVSIPSFEILIVFLNFLRI